MDVGNPNSSQVIVDDLGEVIKLAVKTQDDDFTLAWQSNTLVMRKDIDNTFYAPSYLQDYNHVGMIPAVIQIGAWNMDTGDTKQVAHGLGAKWLKIIDVSVVIRNDAAGLIFSLPVWNYLSNQMEAGLYTIDATNITLKRFTGGLFDSASFSSIAISRGKIVVWMSQSDWVI